MKLLLIGFMCLLSITSYAVDHTFNYQGELTDAGSPAGGSTGAPYDIAIQAFDAAEFGNTVGTVSIHNGVIVTNGLFSIPDVDLGIATFDGLDIWLQVSVKKPADASFTPLIPLQKMTSVPYATTLIDKGASNGQVLTFDNTTGWQPATPAVGFDGAFSSLTGVPAGLADGDDDTQLTAAQVDGIVADNGYLTSETDPIYSAWDKSSGISITESQISDLNHVASIDVGNYGTVVNPITGKTWLDRNLGASQVATSVLYNAASAGDLYQWGRSQDGHQKINSVLHDAASLGLASSWVVYTSPAPQTWEAKFIYNTMTPHDWLSTPKNDLWSGTDAENNPCPSGFRVPTIAEWNQERRSWSSDDFNGAFASPLKIPSAGIRRYTDGSIYTGGGYYWSSTTSGNKSYNISINSGITIAAQERAWGFSIRCIKD